MKKGFTLAEVLITLSIIGVVAAITIPQLVKNMNDYAFTKSKEVTLAKIIEATNQMKSNDVLSGYSTNDAFVNEFQKYMKVTKTCDSTTLVNCFPAKFKTGTGKDIDTSTLTTGTQLGDNNIVGNTTGLMLANGTSILFTLRDSAKVAGACDRIDPTDNQSSTTGCMSFLYDINGYGSPNVMGKDIGSVNAAISTCDGKTLGALCVDTVDLIKGTTYSSIASGSTEYNALKAKGLIQYDSTESNDYWAGAVKACDAKEMRLPTLSELNIIFANQGTIGGFSAEYYWSSEEASAGFAKYQYFSGGHTDIIQKFFGTLLVRCVK